MNELGVRKLFNFLFHYFVPISDINSFKDAIELATYYRTGSKNQHGYIFLTLFYSFLSCLIARGALNLFYNDFLADIYGYVANPPTNLKMGGSATSFGGSELVMIRLWLFYIYSMYPNYINQFIGLEPIIDPNVRSRLLTQAKIIIFIISFLAPIVAPFFFFLYTQNATRIRLIAGTFWSIMTLYIIRYSVCDLIVLYYYSYGLASATFGKVNRIKEKFERLLMSTNINSDLDVADVINDYKKISTIIKQISVVVSFLLVSANIFAIPLFSIAWLLAIQPTNSPAEYFFNVSQSFMYLLYSTRGYILTAYLSNVHTSSKSIYSTIYSILLRAKLSRRAKKQLNLMIEDLGDARCQLAYRDSNDGYISQRDTMINVTRTVEIFFLSFSLFQKKI